MPKWKFLTNHSLVLCSIAQQRRITAREIASLIGITEKATRNIITDLEVDGYITKKKEGRRIKYGINTDLPLRINTTQDTDIGDLLETLGWKRRPKPSRSKIGNPV
ncbi:MAG: winged helix-turn-helix domain-containing protein, partial [Dehalococcoidia bacterium]|nr:winged helix-turn-helix domain-containing protein [Dehalococcoidia bacterium]